MVCAATISLFLFFIFVYLYRVRRCATNWMCQMLEWKRKEERERVCVREWKRKGVRERERARENARKLERKRDLYYCRTVHLSIVNRKPYRMHNNALLTSPRYCAGVRSSSHAYKTRSKLIRDDFRIAFSAYEIAWLYLSCSISSFAYSVIVLSKKKQHKSNTCSGGDNVDEK